MQEDNVTNIRKAQVRAAADKHINPRGALEKWLDSDMLKSMLGELDNNTIPSTKTFRHVLNEQGPVVLAAAQMAFVTGYQAALKDVETTAREIDPEGIERARQSVQDASNGVLHA